MGCNPVFGVDSRMFVRQRSNARIGRCGQRNTVLIRQTIRRINRCWNRSEL